MYKITKEESADFQPENNEDWVFQTDKFNDADLTNVYEEYKENLIKEELKKKKK